MAQGTSTYTAEDVNDDGQSPLWRYRHKRGNNIKVEDKMVGWKDKAGFIRLQTESNGVFLWRQ